MICVTAHLETFPTWSNPTLTCTCSRNFARAIWTSTVTAGARMMRATGGMPLFVDVAIYKRLFRPVIDALVSRGRLVDVDLSMNRAVL